MRSDDGAAQPGAMDRDSAAGGNTAWRLLRRVLEVQPAEVPALGLCWAYILALLSSYYILRPIRDAAGIAGGVGNLPWLFTGTLLAMLAVNIPFAWLVRTLPRSRFIPITYRFFAANLLLFAAAMHWAGPAWSLWVGRVFFIWTSVFNLFVVSVFWAMIVDVFDSEQGKRLFGFIAGGATVGAILGSALTAGLAGLVPSWGLLLAAAALLEVAVLCVRRLSRLSRALDHRPEGDKGERAIGGGVLAGIRAALGSTYLLNVSLFLLLYALTSTLLYFQQASIVHDSFHSRQAQTAFFASVDLAVNLLTLATQIFLTGRLTRLFGVGRMLATLPAVSVLGFSALAMMPVLGAVVPYQVARRASNFALARPSREVLFTVVPREDRYKAKAFIDTVVYRLGDQAGIWLAAALKWLGWGLTEVSLLAVPLSLLWLGNAVWLGRRQERLAAQQARRKPVIADPSGGQVCIGHGLRGGPAAATNPRASSPGRSGMNG